MDLFIIEHVEHVLCVFIGIHLLRKRLELPVFNDVDAGDPVNAVMGKPFMVIAGDDQIRPGILIDDITRLHFIGPRRIQRLVGSVTQVAEADRTAFPDGFADQGQIVEQFLIFRLLRIWQIDFVGILFPVIGAECFEQLPDQLTAFLLGNEVAGMNRIA